MMTVEDRIADIQKRTGLDTNIIRGVLNAETESVIESLKRGERATLIGRCSFVPYLRTHITPQGTIGNCIRVSCKASPKMEAILKAETSFKEEADNDGIPDEIRANVLLSQIKELA